MTQLCFNSHKQKQISPLIYNKRLLFGFLFSNLRNNPGFRSVGVYDSGSNLVFSLPVGGMVQEWKENEQTFTLPSSFTGEYYFQEPEKFFHHQKITRRNGVGLLLGFLSCRCHTSEVSECSVEDVVSNMKPDAVRDQFHLFPNWKRLSSRVWGVFLQVWIVMESWSRDLLADKIDWLT